MPKFWLRARRFVKLESSKESALKLTSSRFLLSSPNEPSLIHKSEVVGNKEDQTQEAGKVFERDKVQEKVASQDEDQNISARFTILYDFPLEIRQQIYFWILQYHEEQYEATYCLHGRNTTHPTVPIDTGPRHPLALMPFWGSKAMSSIFPVSKQWYSEMQYILYAKYTFEMSIRYLTPELTLGFLPPQALRSIRQIHILVSLDWNPLLNVDITSKELLQAYNQIASNFGGLQRVEFSVYTRHQENHKLILGANVGKFVRTVLDIHQAFNRTKEVRIVPWPQRYTFPYSHSGYFEAFELLHRECGRILEAGKSGVRYIPMNMNRWKQDDGWGIWKI